jgi:hypothetical protein
MSEYRIEKLRRPVAVVLRNGRRLEGDVFVGSQARLHDGPEDPSEHFNHPAPFFALSLREGEVLLVSKEQVAWVELMADTADNYFDVPHVGLEVEVELADGCMAAGSVFPETRVEHARLLDFLNEYAPTVLAVFAADRIRLVNRRVIAHVKQLT